ncbi:hypothetical protein KP509_21G002000 [Ceratopteris richardii]|uniref:Uncharacterized protein n=1 Tax=Ceratopteris richardii TaxID=49495 RepID=A0A8T2S731_CERRI|nr:hypothetical protein KP509_21G002000 [Ceratopteris richardii]
MGLYMMHHVLVAKGSWNIVYGVEKHPIKLANTVTEVDADGVEDGDILPVHVRDAFPVAPTIEQLRWDGRDAHTHPLIALSVKRAIIPHILSCKTVKDAWNTRSCISIFQSFFISSFKSSSFLISPSLEIFC